MRALLVDDTGRNPKMNLGNAPDPLPGEYELLVKIKATALNRADLLQKSGHYPPPNGASPILGLEMAGIVEDTGPEVTRYEKGDLVFGLLPGGGYAEYCVIHERMAMHIPEGFSFEEAAAIPEVFLTAFQALKLLGKIKRNENILIHAGASGVGTAAIQLAKKLFNCTVITTSSKKKKLKSCLELGADIAINYKKQDFAEVITKKLGTSSIDLILDFVGAPYWEKNIEIIAMDGRFIYLALLGGAKLKQMNLVPILRKRLTILGSTLRNRPEEYKMNLTSDFHSYAMELIENRLIKPVIYEIFDWSNVDKAHKVMEKNRNIGKIILNGM